MTPSVSKAISGALERTKTILFDTFDLAKWFKLAFCCWLANLFAGGESGAKYMADGRSRELDAIEDWFHEWIWLALPLALLSLVVLVFLRWIQSRGIFVFLDGLANNRGAVIQPWNEQARVADNYFKLSLSVEVIIPMVVFGALGGMAFLLAQAVDEVWPAVLVGVILIAPLVLVLLLAQFVMHNFISPVMYARKIGVRDAWHATRDEVLGPHLGSVFLLLIVKLVTILAIFVTLVLSLIFCCCLAVIPYIGTVLILPVLVFERCLTLSWLEQLGEGWQVYRFGKESPEASV